MKLPKLFQLERWEILIPMVMAAICVAVVRQLWWLYLIDLRGPLGPAAVFVVCGPFVIIFTVCALVFFALVASSIKWTGSLIPTLVLVAGIGIAFLLPLSPKPDTPEKLHFLQYRPDYEAVVELARNNQLEQALPDCRAGFRPPDALKHVSSKGCMHISVDNYYGRGLHVEFNPIESFYHPVVYVEFDEFEYPCGGDLSVEQKIDDHWYVCQRDWN